MKFFVCYDYKAFLINLHFLNVVGVCPKFDLTETFFKEKRFKKSNSRVRTFCLLFFARCLLIFPRYLLLFACCSLFFHPLYVMKVSYKLKKNAIENVLTSLLIASAKILGCEGRSSPSSFYAWLLVRRVSLIYLVDEFFIFLLLVLLKERRTRMSPRFDHVVFVFGVNQEN